MKASRWAVPAATVALALAGCGGSDEPQDPLARDAAQFFGDDGSPLDVRARTLGEEQGYTGVSLSYVGALGERVPSVLATPTGKGPSPCVVFFHGLGGSKDDAQGLAAPMRELGIGVFAYDAPLQGERSDGTLEQVVRDPDRVAALFKQNVIDGRRALDVLAERPECDPERLGVVGLSFGGLSALLTAAADDRVRTTVTFSVADADNPTVLGEGLVARDDPQAREAALKAFRPLSATRWVKRISPRALLLVNGREDPLNPLDVVEPLQEAAGEGSETYLYDGGHNPFEGPSAAGVLDRVKAFEAARLVPAPARSPGP